MSECTHDCDTCESKCSDKSSMLEELNEFSKVKKVIGVVSGKGGVGKSMVTSMLAVLMQRRGYRTAILDADVTGPSIPKTFGITSKSTNSAMGLMPAVSSSGVKIMSINLLLEKDTEPVIWRGPVIAGVVKQFWTDVYWDEVDFMFVDMPPGTGDVPLTVFQSIPVDGIIVVTSPQDLVSMIVEKAVNMAKMMNVPILGIIENYSYFICPNCKEKHYIYGESSLERVAERYNLNVFANMPIDSTLAKVADEGLIESYNQEWCKQLAENLIKAVL